MAVFKKHLTPLSKGGKLDLHRGKGATQEVLPSRHALNTLTGGSLADRSMNQYAKSTPSVEQAAGDTPSPLDTLLPSG